MPPAEVAVEICSGLDTLSVAAAERLVTAARTAIVRRKRFVIALAGGHTPKTLYQLLAAEYHDRIQWRQVVVYFGDERCVPSHNPESNYAMAAGALLSHVPIPKKNVFRIAGELAAADAAHMYERKLRAQFPDAAQPTFDVCVLGVGPDGHTASLFPGSPALEEQERWAIPVDAPPEYAVRERITLTPPVLRRSREVFFLASGEEKRAVLAHILSHDAEAARLPAAMIQGRERTLWLLDRAAAPAPPA